VSPDEHGIAASDALVGRAHSLLAQIEDAGVQARALGGVAVALRCPSARHAPLQREFHDLDLAVARGHAHDLTKVLAGAGFAPNTHFNALHGRSRLIFAAVDDGLHLDVLVGVFAMCHKLDLGDRLAIDPATLTLADLALTKLQIAELNRKDAGDLAALFLDHALADDDSGINVNYMTSLLSRDWGWWRTVTANLDLLERHLPGTGLAPAQTAVVAGRIDELRHAVATTKKSLAWRSRAKLGDRVSWRDEPEEVSTG